MNTGKRGFEMSPAVAELFEQVKALPLENQEEMLSEMKNLLLKTDAEYFTREVLDECDQRLEQFNMGHQKTFTFEEVESLVRNQPGIKE